MLVTKPTRPLPQTSFKNHMRQRGITLLELIAGLAIISIIIVGALALVSQADTSAKSEELLKGVSGLRANIRGLFENQATYGATGAPLTATLINAKAVPDNWVDRSGTNPAIKTPFGTAATVAVDSASASKYVVTLSTIPQEACIRFLTAVGSASDWDGIKVGTTAVALPVTVALANTRCTPTAPATTVNIALTGSK